MDESDFEGTVVLERLAAVGKLHEFLDAVDSDSFVAANRIMRTAGIDEQTIAVVLQKMRDA